MNYPPDMLDTAHKHGSRHRDELQRSEVCGCFYCYETAAPADVEHWCDDEETALCPTCNIDALIGSASGYPVTETLFLKAMHERWFS